MPRYELNEGTGHSIEDLCSAIEGYFEALRLAGFDLHDQILPPQPDKNVAALEKKLGAPLPQDLRVFLRRGLRGARGSIEEGGAFASIGFDFIDCKAMEKTTRMLRKIAEETIDDEEDPHAELVRDGVALTYAEPQLLLAGGVHHFSFRNPPLRVGASFGEFLRDWLASGCFCSHAFDLAWRHVKKHVPLAIPPAKNAWLRAYGKQFPSTRQK